MVLYCFKVKGDKFGLCEDLLCDSRGAVSDLVYYVFY